jgi:cytochrome c2
MKKTNVCVASCLALTLLLAGCSQASQDNSSASAEPSDSTPSASDKTVEKVQTDTAASETEKNTGVVGISGSHITDVRLGLYQYMGMPQGSIAHTKMDTAGEMMTSSTYEIPEAAISFGYDLTCDKDFQITSGIFSFDSYGYELKESLPDETVLEVATEYLGYCITVPYDAADQEAAKQWLTDNLSNYADGATTTIGDATFTLSGFKRDDIDFIDIVLYIRKSDLDEQIIANSNDA